MGLAEHCAHDDGPADVVGDLGVAADKGDADVFASIGDLVEGLLDLGTRGMFSGTRRVARNHRGSAPVAAMSLALTWTEYQPISSEANVMGSVLATRTRSSDIEMTAASSPMPGPMRTRGSVIGASERGDGEGGRGGVYLFA